MIRRRRDAIIGQQVIMDQEKREQGRDLSIHKLVSQ